MRSANQVYIMLLREGRHYFLSKCERYSTIVLGPALDIFVGIGPEEVAEEAGVGDVGGTHYALDLV